MLLDKKTFNFRRTTIPTAAKEQQARMKRAMRAAINQESWDYRFDQIVAAVQAGDTSGYNSQFGFSTNPNFFIFRRADPTIFFS